MSDKATTNAPNDEPEDNEDGRKPRITLDMTVDDAAFLNELAAENGKVLRSHDARRNEPRPDLLVIRTGSNLKFNTVHKHEDKPVRTSWRSATIKIRVAFYPTVQSIGCLIDGNPVEIDPATFNIPGNDLHKLKELQSQLAQSNDVLGIIPPKDTLPSGSRKVLSRPHPLSEQSVVRVPNDTASNLFTKMITRPGLWLTNENECHKYAQEGKSVLIYRPDEEIPDYWLDLREQVLQSLESRFTAMKGELVADVADILFWHWLSNDRPRFAEITLGQVLEYRAIKARPNVIEEHWQAIRDVRAIHLRGDGIENENLFYISAAQTNLWGTADPPKLKTVYRYHPGYFLAEAIQRDAFFLAYYARSVWQLDYYRDANAKKLARVLRADWRRNAESYLPGGPARYRTWKALLADAGISTDSGVAVSHPMRFIKSIEGEVEKLYSNAEYIRECGPAIYHPDDQKKREKLPRFNPLAAWEALRTHIAPAADITDALTKTATRRLAYQEQLRALAAAPASKKNLQKKSQKKASGA